MRLIRAVTPPFAIMLAVSSYRALGSPRIARKAADRLVP